MSKHHDHTIACAVTWNALETALSRPTSLSKATLRALVARVEEEEDDIGAVIVSDPSRELPKARCAVLRAYRRFLQARLEARE